MTKTISAMKLRQSLGKTLDMAYYQNQCTIINRANNPIAAIIPFIKLKNIENYSLELSKKIEATAKRNSLNYSDAFKLSEKAKEYSRR